MVGLMLGSTSSGERIRELVHPLRDAFGAIFFFAFGLSIDPGDLPTVVWPVLIAVAVTFLMNVLAGLAAARIHRFGPRPAANIATALLARGEFALILATMAASAGLDERLSPFIAGYVLILAVLGPLAAGRSGRWRAYCRAGRRTTGPVDGESGARVASRSWCPAEAPASGPLPALRAGPDRAGRQRGARARRVRSGVPADQQQRTVVVDVLGDGLDQMPGGALEAAGHIAVGLTGQPVDALGDVPVGRLDQAVREHHQHVAGAQRALDRVELGAVVDPEQRARPPTFSSQRPLPALS